MPKKGEALPYRVTFQYPGQKEHRRAHRTLSQAEKSAGEIGQNGAPASVLVVLGPSQEQRVAEFGPDVFHLFDWRNANDPQKGLFCRCGRIVTEDEDARDHMIYAGLCPDCWGTGALSQRATRAPGVPMAGNLIDCPACKGSGMWDDYSHLDVDTTTYYTRLEMLQLESGQGSPRRND